MRMDTLIHDGVEDNDDGMETISFSGSEDNAGENSSDDSNASLSSFAEGSDGLIPLESVVDVSDIPNSVESARRKLSLILDRTDWYNLPGHNFVWQVLQKYPVLAASTFEDPFNEMKYPLALLVRARARLEIIESVFQIFPQAISRRNGSHQDTVLHDACWYGCSTEIVKFLAMEFPEALTKTNDYRRLPVHDSMRNNTSKNAKSETVRMLIEMYPDSMTLRDNDGKWLLETAFGLGYERDLLEWMICRWPHGQIDSLNCSSPASIPMDESRQKLVTKALPHLKFLRCDPHSWTSDGFVQLMGGLTTATSLDVLEMLAFPGQLLLNSQEAKNAFQNFMEHTNLSKLIIVFPRVENLLENFCDVCLGLIETALQKNTTLRRLELRQLLLSHATTLSRLLTTARSPKELVLQQIAFNGRTEKLSSSPANTSGGIEKLDIIDCAMTPEAMEHLVHNVARMTNLKSLKLKFNPSAPGASYLGRLDITDALVSILHQNKIRSLKVDPLFKYNFAPFCEALRVNSSLRVIDSEQHFSYQAKDGDLASLLDVLQKDNTTLEHCGLISTGRHDKVREKAIELLRLNRFGRGRARDRGATACDLLKDLVMVETTASFKLPLDKFNVHFGLLRETPSVWCCDKMIFEQTTT